MNAFQHRPAHRVDQQLESADVEFEIVLALFLFEAQAVLQAGTAATGNEDTQAGDRVLGAFDKTLHGFCGTGSEFDHRGFSWERGLWFTLCNRRARKENARRNR